MVNMKRRRGMIVLMALLTTLCQPLTFAQGVSLSQQLSEMEVVIFNKDFSSNSAVWRIEHLEKNFPAAGKQKKKDLPTRMRDLTEQIQPQSLQTQPNIPPQQSMSPEGTPGSYISDPYNLDPYSSRLTKPGNSKNPIGQAVGVPKSVLGGTKRAIDRFKDFEDGAGYVPATSTHAHKFSGADGWSQEANALDWYRPGNMRGFTPHYVDGSASNDTGAYESGRTTTQRRPSYQSQHPRYPQNSRYPQRPQSSYANELDDDDL